MEYQGQILMMEAQLLRKSWSFLIALSLLVLLVPACGGGKEKTPAPMPSPTFTATLAPTPKPTPTEEPVKIGAIGPWSGEMAAGSNFVDEAIALVEEMVKDQGGILGGREVEFVRGDDRGNVAESAGQATKLILDDKVDILTLGGVTAASMSAVADVAEQHKVPYVSFGHLKGLSQKKYSIGIMGENIVESRTADFIIDVLKPKTVAWLAYDDISAHSLFEGDEEIRGVKERLQANGITVVYEQYFSPLTSDFTPYLTKIKYLNPDVLVTFGMDPNHLTIVKQMGELGGWGRIKYFAASDAAAFATTLRQPSAVGTYVAVNWLPGTTDDPGAKAFEDAYRQKYGRPPAIWLGFQYNCLWTAIKAIELAGTTDHDKVAEAMRSGNLEWDSVWGPLRVSPEGEGNFQPKVAQIQEGGKLVKVWPQ
jgi:branched-chain amino acid transport system substrate-binding protein